jgi:hypothetical protein
LARKRLIAAALATLVLGAAGGAFGASATVEVPMRDPWVPPEAAKKARVEPASRGATLAQEVDRKLRARFDAAAGPSGRLTREGAQAAGLGFIAQHFDAIDRRHAGRVSYEDYRQFLLSRGAHLE